MKKILRLWTPLCLLVTACSHASAPASTADAPLPFAQKKTNGGFENAYYVSFAFDTCGDEDTGAIYRAKLRAQALHCSLPETSLAAFQRAATRMDDVMPEKVAAYHQQFGDHPEKSGDYECSAILRQTPTMPDCNQP